MTLSSREMLRDPPSILCPVCFQQLSWLMKPRDKASAKRKTGELSTHCSSVSPQISGYLRSIPPRHSGSDDDHLKVKMQQKFLIIIRDYSCCFYFSIFSLSQTGVTFPFIDQKIVLKSGNIFVICTYNIIRQCAWICSNLRAPIPAISERG